jgi:hypothetical protein
MGAIAISKARLADLKIDGGFDPGTAIASLRSCVQAKADTIVENCHILNASGSCLVGTGARIQYRNNRLESFGDHAVYLLGELDGTPPYAPTGPTKGAVISGNTIIDDLSLGYHNNVAYGVDRRSRRRLALPSLSPTPSLEIPSP